ncbi:hypothetical protein C0584_02250, partial [Candidatus Parcubacteria bacterium]
MTFTIIIWGVCGFILLLISGLSIGLKNAPAAQNTSENTNSSNDCYNGFIDPDNKYLALVGSLILFAITYPVMVISLNLFTTGDWRTSPNFELVVFGTASIAAWYIALHFMKKTSLRPFVILNVIATFYILAWLMISSFLGINLSLRDIGSIFGAPQWSAQVRAKVAHQKVITNFKVMRLVKLNNKAESWDFVDKNGVKTKVKLNELVRVQNTEPNYGVIGNIPDGIPWIMVIQKDPNTGFYSGKEVPVPYEFLKTESSSSLFANSVKEKNVTSRKKAPSDYKIYQKGTYTFNLKAGKSTDIWIMFPSGVNY